MAWHPVSRIVLCQGPLPASLTRSADANCSQRWGGCCQPIGQTLAYMVRLPHPEPPPSSGDESALSRVRTNVPKTTHAPPASAYLQAPCMVRPPYCQHTYRYAYTYSHNVPEAKRPTAADVETLLKINSLLADTHRQSPSTQRCSTRRCSITGKAYGGRCDNVKVRWFWC